MATRVAAVRRDTARVLPVSADGAVLLLEELDPAEAGRPYWSSIGGGIDAGESAVQAAVRELWEETGLVARAEDLLGPVHVGERAWTWSGEHRTGVHTWFAMRIPRVSTVSFEHLEAEETDTVVGSGWWTPDGLEDLRAAHGPHVLRPPDLAAIMRTALTVVRDHYEGER